MSIENALSIRYWIFCNISNKQHNLYIYSIRTIKKKRWCNHTNKQISKFIHLKYHDIIDYSINILIMLEKNKMWDQKTYTQLITLEITWLFNCLKDVL